jgi:protein-L-isoaspartate O-methyltransferase
MNKLVQIEFEVRRAEKRFLKPPSQRVYGIDHWSFRTQAPRKARHAITSAFLLLSHIQEAREAGGLELSPDWFCADLGSGLGMSTFSLALRFGFKTVVGYELDEHVIARAERTQQRHGIENVKFEHKDFLEEDLTPYKLLYVYQPFSENFVGYMTLPMRETAPGTIVIARIANFFREQIFAEPFFRLIYASPKNRSLNPFLAEFYTFQRTAYG